MHWNKCLFSPFYIKEMRVRSFKDTSPIPQRYCQKYSTLKGLNLKIYHISHWILKITWFPCYFLTNLYFEGFDYSSLICHLLRTFVCDLCLIWSWKNRSWKTCNKTRCSHIAGLMYKRAMVPEYLDERQLTRQFNTKKVLKVLDADLSKTFKIPIYYGSTLWNALPRDVRDADTYKNV